MATKAQIEEGLKALKLGLTQAPDLGEFLKAKGHLTAVQTDIVRREQDGTKSQPRIMGNYEIIELVGKGGMGSVYRARQISMDRIVALKVLDAERTRNESFRKRFIREARAAAALNHANIVRAIDAGEHDGMLYFVMEFVAAENVAQILQKRGPIPEDRAVDITIQIARALAHADRARLIHRDVKPENILIDLGGVAKLTDLGLAKSMENEEECITQAGRAMGTPYYISPEQIRLEPNLDIRADIYSLGATLYQMLTGSPPFYAESPAAIVSMHLTAAPPSPKKTNPSLSDGICSIVARMLEKDRDRRYRTPQDLLSDLETLRWGMPQKPPGAAGGAGLPEGGSPFPEFSAPGSKPPPMPGKSRIGVGTLMAVVVLGSIAAVVFVLAVSGGEDGNQKSDAWTEDSRPAEPPAPEPRPGPSKPPGPQTPPRNPPPKPAPQKFGEEELAAAKKFIAAEPGAYSEIFSMLDDVIRKFPGGTAAILAAKEKEAAIGRLDAEASELLREIQKQADLLAAAQKFGEALAAFDRFPGRLAVGSWAAKIEEGRRRIRSLGDEETLRVLKVAAELIQNGKFDKAEDLLEKAREFGLPAHAAEVEKSLKDAREARFARTRASFLDGFFKATSGGDLIRAEEFIANRLADQEYACVSDVIRTCSSCVSSIRRVLDARSESLRGLRGKDVDFLLKEGRVVFGRLDELKDGKVEVSYTDKVRISTSFPEEELGISALASMLGQPESGAWLDVAAFELFRLSDFEASRQAARRAAEAGADTSAFSGILDSIEMGRIQSLLEEAGRVANSSPDRSAAIMTELLETHRSAVAFPGKRKEIKRILDALAGKTDDPLPELDSRAKIKAAGQDKIRRYYDNSSTAMLDDYQRKGGSFRIEDGVLRQQAVWKENAEAKPTVWLPGFHSSATVEVEFRAPAHTRWVGILFFDSGGGRHVAFQMIHTIKRPRPDGLYVGFFMPEEIGGNLVFDNGLPVMTVSEKSLCEPAEPFDPRKYHRLKVRFEPGKAWGFYDGQQVQAADLPGYESGRIGVVMASPGYFNYISILTDRKK